MSIITNLIRIFKNLTHPHISRRNRHSRIRYRKPKLGKYGGIEMDIYHRMNNERKKNKRSKITWDNDSYHIAQRRAREISHNFSHSGCPAGYGENIAKIPLGRVRGLGYIRYRSLGRAFIRTWMTSQGHRANILDSKYSRVTVGVAKRGNWYYGVQLFHF
jgi:uncharacterized protein YkwD